MADQRLRTIKIKTGVLKRLVKDRVMYEREVSDQEQKINDMNKKGADEYDVRKQMEVLQESRNMIPDVTRKITAAKEELASLLESAGELSDREEYKNGKDVLDSVN